MAEHALLSASSANRWLICTAAPRYEEKFPETTSIHAKKGQLAHSICELKLTNKFAPKPNRRTYTTKLNKLKKDPLYEAEMERTSEQYVDYLTQISMEYTAEPLVCAEFSVDLSDYVPEGFGTCDCVMLGGDMLDIVDYKHGLGVPVPAVGNAQMRLYALGALKLYEPFYGDRIKRVRMSIVQPRVKDEPESEIMSVEELKLWGESIKPIAQIAYSGFGEYVPGEHCRFCRGNALCRVRAEKTTALRDFAEIVNGRATKKPEKLSLEEVGEYLNLGKCLDDWYKDLKDYALNKILAGAEIPGWKAVAGRSNRAFTDQDAALAAIIAAGYDEAVIYERKPKTLTALEKLMGKDEFEKVAGALVIKSMGKPTLVTENDKRTPYSSAAADFTGVVNQ